MTYRLPVEKKAPAQRRRSPFWKGERAFYVYRETKQGYRAVRKVIRLHPTQGWKAA